MGPHSVHSLNVPVLCFYLAWWWLNEPKHVAEFLIVNIDYQHMLCLLPDKITILSQNTKRCHLSKWREIEKWNFQRRVYYFFNYVKSMSLGVRITCKSFLKTIGLVSWNSEERSTVNFVCLCYSVFFSSYVAWRLHAVRMPP